MRAHDHNVWPYVKFLGHDAIAAFVRDPGADIHVGDSHGVDVGLASSQAVFDPLHEHGIEATGLIVWVTRYTREARPFVAALPEHAVRPGRTFWPVENRRVIGDEGWPRSQRVCELRGIGCGMAGGVLTKSDGGRRRCQEPDETERSGHTTEKMVCVHTLISLPLVSATHVPALN